MAAPNIVGVVTVTGITTALNVTTTPTVFLGNAVNSGKVMKVNSIIVSNIDGSSAADINIKYHTASAVGAGTSISLAHTISVAADSTLVALDKASTIYVQEGQSLVSYASANGDLDITCSYEEISS